MSQTESFDFPGPAGRLEAVLMLPEAPPAATAIVCHAHPLHGGMMHFKVVFRAAKALQRRGAAVLRFNFRGVGRSQGSHDQGRGEKDDVRAALDELDRRFPGRPVALGGFSFGASMALQVGVADTRARALFALGLPLSLMPDTGFLDACRKPRLFVQGERDTFGDGDAVLGLAARLPEPKWVVVVPGTDHFFSDTLDALEDAVSDWAGARPWEAA